MWNNSSYKKTENDLFMTFKEYFWQTKETTKHGLKLSGLIFTACFAAIGVAVGFKEGFTYKSIELFLLCVILGNGFSLLILALPLVMSYKRCKAVIRFYESIPGEIKDDLGLILVERQRNARYNYLELDIVDTTREHPFVFNFDDKFVWITLICDLRTVGQFQKRMYEVQKKYKKERVELTGWGLKKNIPKKEWRTISYERVKVILEELQEISNNEAFEIVKRNIDGTDAS